MIFSIIKVHEFLYAVCGILFDCIPPNQSFVQIVKFPNYELFFVCLFSMPFFIFQVPLFVALVLCVFFLYWPWCSQHIFAHHGIIVVVFLQ